MSHRITIDRNGGPMIIAAFGDKAESLLRYLRKQGMECSIDAGAVPVDGRRPLDVLHLPHDADLGRVQLLLEHWSAWVEPAGRSAEDPNWEAYQEELRRIRLADIPE